MSDEVLEQIATFTNEQLQEKLEELGLSLTGSRPVLLQRLKEALSANLSTTGVGDSKMKNKSKKKKSGKNSDGLDDLTVKELKAELDAMNLKSTGKKAELVMKLRVAKEIREEKNRDDSDDDAEDGDNDVESDGEDSEVDEIVDEDFVEHNTQRPVRRRTEYRAVAVTFKDVEDTLEKFSGVKGENVHRWIVNFEETADVCEWTDNQKMIYLKKMLRGSAKLFVNFECSAKTYTKLKKSLVQEFAKTLDSQQVHQQLSSVRKKGDETYQQYAYRVMEMASHATMELSAKIQYIINGIPDDEVNKTILYGATSMKQFRSKLMIYEIQKTNVKSRTQNNKPQTNDKAKKEDKMSTKDGKSTEKTRRCYNCGSKAHLSNECPDKTKGPKCFKCREFGHVATKCPKDEKTAGSTSSKPLHARCDVLMSNDKKTYKKAKLLNKDVNAVLDSGSDLHLMRTSLYMKLGAPQLKLKIIPFEGVGSVTQYTLGRFKADIYMDNMKFTFDFDVVPDEYIGHDLLIGAELSDYAEVRFKNRQATLIELTDESVPPVVTDDNGWNEALNVNTFEKNCEEKVIISHVKDPEVKAELKKLIESYEPKQELDTGVKMHVVLKDDVPVYQNPRRLSAEQKRVVNEIVDRWMKEGVVRPSVSDYTSPIVLVAKKNGQMRLCVDYRLLNKKVVKDRNPLPLIEDQLDRLQDARVFATLDLKDGFFHVPIDESSIKYTSFVVPDGQFEFLKMPFGFCNSPAVFQRPIRAVFRKLIADGVVLSYLDDLIVPAKNERDCLEKLKLVFDTASKYGVVFNWDKCDFLLPRVEYLGYVVEAGQYKPSPKKTLAVEKFPKPTNIKELQSFLGLTGVFRKFMKLYAFHARPLTELLKKDAKFEFGPRQEAAFEKLKSALMSSPMLKLYRVGAETELHTDACMGGLGAILLQKDAEDGKFHPVYFASWKTSMTEERYTSYELEVLAIVKALKKFHVYLLNIQFKIVTDCQAFVLAMRKKNLSLRVSHWALLLEQYNYSIEHRPGTAMRHVDALSRNPVEVLSVQEGRSGLTEKIIKAQQEDAELQKIFKSLTDGKKSEFSVTKGGVLYRDVEGTELLVVPKAMQFEIIKEAHECGHFGWRKTEYMLKRDFWFPDMRKKVQKLIENCVQCLLAERKHGKSEGWLTPIDKGCSEVQRGRPGGYPENPVRRWIEVLSEISWTIQDSVCTAK